MSLKRALDRLPIVQEKFNVFVSHLESLQPQTIKSAPLSNTVAAIKDNIVTKDFPTTCASNILRNYKSPFDATVVSLLKKNGSIIIGKSNLDEFGMGSLGIHTAFNPVKNPLNENWCIGGSSSGSAAAVASDLVDFSLGTDTGGSVRLPSAYSSIYGFKPSYGRISRWGVIAFAQSLDTVGILSKDIDMIIKVFQILDKYDPRDPTSLSNELREKLISNTKIEKQSNSLKIGIPLEFIQSEISPEIKSSFIKFIENLMNKGLEIYPVSIPSIKNSLPIYYTLMPAEAASNLARYDGIRYGERDTNNPDIIDNKFYNNTRAQFGQEVKNRIILGNYNLCSDGYKNNFIKAQNLRVQLINEFNDIFAFENVLTNRKPIGTIDMIICPTNLTPPQTIRSAMNEKNKANPLNEYINDVFTIPMSLAGLPAISIPAETGKPYGIQIATQYGNDDALLKFIKNLNG